jgi:hypothetical protein
VVDPARAVVTCTEEESRGSEMFDIHPLAVFGENFFVMKLDYVAKVLRINLWLCSF